MARVKRIVLIGFSGTGKSTIARLLADRLGWAAADTDEAIEQEWGLSIPEIFRDHGEPAFRESERTSLARLLEREEVVVATGGGAVVDEAAWSESLLRRDGTLVLALEAAPETILARLQAQAASEGGAVERPMLAGLDPLARIEDLKARRQQAYDSADLTVVVDRAGPDAIAEELARIVLCMTGEAITIRLDAASAASDIVIAPGALTELGRRVHDRWPAAQRAWVVTDAHVGPLHGPVAAQALRDVGLDVKTHAVPAGEGSKSLTTTGELYDWMLGNGVERGDVVIALGGGVVGDLAGFVAATVLRGIGLVQVPTSLLAMVDSSVGGKTGINHAAGKNLIGAFLQPPLVLVDTDLLQTLPPRELRSGWGEVVKHAVIQHSTPGGERGDLREFLRRNAGQLTRLESPAIPYVVWRNIALKAAVVAADEREGGIRAYLNFGHTIGHAVEAADYQLLHGEAVAVGMAAASTLGATTGACGEAEAAEIRDLVTRFELPTSAQVDEERVLALMKSDKKRAAGRQRFVLPMDGGGVAIHDGVPETAVRAALASIRSAVAVA